MLLFSFLCIFCSSNIENEKDNKQTNYRITKINRRKAFFTQNSIFQSKALPKTKQTNQSQSQLNFNSTQRFFLIFIIIDIIDIIINKNKQLFGFIQFGHSTLLRTKQNNLHLTLVFFF